MNSVVGVWRGFENDRRRAEQQKQAAAERQQRAAEQQAREQQALLAEQEKQRLALEADAADRAFQLQRLTEAQAANRRLIEQRQAEEMRGLELEAAGELGKVRAEAVATEEQRRAALRRAVARQRAKFGLQGVGSSGGSSEAVLFGMVEESDEERRHRERLDRLRETAVGDQLQSKRRRNLLELTEMAEKQRLEWLTLRI